jgi:hypothetical protein
MSIFAVTVCPATHETPTLFDWSPSRASTVCIPLDTSAGSLKGAFRGSICPSIHRSAPLGATIVTCPTRALSSAILFPGGFAVGPRDVVVRDEQLIVRERLHWVPRELLRSRQIEQDIRALEHAERF